MKRVILMTVIFTCFRLMASAQTVRLNNGINLDSTSVIRDSTNRILQPSEWNPIIASGEYYLKFTKLRSGEMEYVLYPWTDEQREARYASLPKPPESKFFKTGETLSSFSADDMNGNGFKLKKLKGKIVVLNFWFIGCPPCRMEIPELNKIALKYTNDPDVVFISFGLDDRYDIKNFLKYSPFNYHIVDNCKMYADLYGIHLYPTNVVLDKEGKVRFHSSGYAYNLPYWIKKTIKECK